MFLIINVYLQEFLSKGLIWNEDQDKLKERLQIYFSCSQNTIKIKLLLQMDNYEQSKQQSKQLAMKMRMGTGANNLLNPQQAPTHYIDTLQRFQKDFASYDKVKRQQEKLRKQQQLERKRIEYLQRQNKRWQEMEHHDRKIKSREEEIIRNQNLGIRRTANSNGLAYNPINLEYDKNPEGQRLKMRDEDARIRGFVRAHNMDTKGNCKYNLLNGENRFGVEQIIPLDLRERYSHRLTEHYENQRLKVPSSNSARSYNIIG